MFDRVLILCTGNVCRSPLAWGLLRQAVHARDTARAESDVDLAVSAGRPLSAAEIMALIGDLGDATGRPVDLIDLATAGEPLLGQILTHGARLLGDSTQEAAWLTRHLIDVADFVPYQRRIWAERRQRWIGR